MTRRPLARTYRPRTFSEVLGQKAPIRALGRAASSGELAAAYILSGTRGIGKTTIARVFAKALNCEKGPAADCCDDCTPCGEIAGGRSLDVLEIDAATHTGIDDVRELREAAQYPPSRERFRVFIIDEAHQLSQAAWNGLLKILEEPPDWCVFLLCTTEPHKIPPTIESRSLHFAFRSPSREELRSHLAEIARRESIEIDDEALDLLVKAADGSVRDGLSALDQVRAVASGESITGAVVREALGLVSGEAIEAYLAALASGDAAAALDVVGDLDGEGQDLRAFMAEALERVRNAALARVRGDRSDALAQTLDGAQSAWLAKVLDETEMRLRQGGSVRTLVDLATVRMTAMAGLTPLGELISRLGSDPAPPAGPGGGSRPVRRPASPPESPPRDAAPPRRPRTSASATGAAQRSAAGGSDAAASPGPTSFARDTGEAISPTPAGSDAPADDPAESVDAASGSAPPRDLVAAVSVAPVSDEALLPALTEAIHTIRPPMAAYLGRAESAALDAAGVLTIHLPDGGDVWKRRLTGATGREALAEAARVVLGAAPKTIRVETLAQPPSTAPAVEAPSTPRHEILDRARKDPVVREIFDRFGAVVLEGGPPPEKGSNPRSTPRSPRSRPSGDARG